MGLVCFASCSLWWNEIELTKRICISTFWVLLMWINRTSDLDVNFQTLAFHMQTGSKLCVSLQRTLQLHCQHISCQRKWDSSLISTFSFRIWIVHVENLTDDLNSPLYETCCITSAALVDAKPTGTQDCSYNTVHPRVRIRSGIHVWCVTT